jgi:dUTPase
VKRLHPNAVIPSYSKDGDAGMDLTITDIKEETKSSITYGYGIVIEIPVGYVGLIIFDNIVIIKNNVALEVKSNNKTYKVGDTYGKLLILPEIKFNLKE